MRSRYGAGPVHLLSLLACFGLSAYVVTRLAHVGHALLIGVWFVGAIVLHDMVLFPLYALAGRGLERAAWRPRSRSRGVPTINHIRVPTLLSGLYLLVSFPLVLELSTRTYRSATGLYPSPYLGRWLGLTGVLLAGSGLIFLARLALARRARV